ncbi:HDOD domain-containing protein [Allohahella marinimesophila]|uniref:HDOD domain-containing protein n=1 Tax=Allohahella marinimesophila TaxID=1054972 RepID=A0ABP7NF96_9GAMM
MNTELTADSLELFHPLYRLSRAQRVLLAARAGRVSLEPGDARRGSEESAKQVLFLLTGEVELQAPELPQVRLAAGAQAARSPLRLAEGHMLTATKAAQLLLVDDLELTQLMKQAPQPGIDDDSAALNNGQAKRLDVADAADEASQGYRIVVQISRDLQNRCLSLPSLPLAADRIRRAAADPECDVARIADIVQTDPAITAKIIYAVNSPLFRGFRKIESCRDAVIRLGVETTKQLVALFTVRELFTTRHEKLRIRMEKLWQHSIEVGTLASVIAERVPGVNPGQALLAGLLHDIGAIPVIQQAAALPAARRHDDLLEHLITDLREEIGVAMLREWGFPDSVIASVEHAERYTGDFSEAVPLCADIVTLAQVHAFIGTAEQASLPPMNRIPAFKRLARFNITPQESLNIIELARAQSATVFEVTS